MQVDMKGSNIVITLETLDEQIRMWHLLSLTEGLIDPSYLFTWQEDPVVATDEMFSKYHELFKQYYKERLNAC